MDAATGEYAALSRLTPPPADKALIENWLAAGKQSLASGKAFVAALKARDSAQVKTIATAGGKASLQARAFAARYGLKACSTALQ